MNDVLVAGSSWMGRRAAETACRSRRGANGTAGGGGDGDDRAMGYYGLLWEGEAREGPAQMIMGLPMVL